MLGAIVIICVSFLLCSFGGITINTEKEKCKNEEEFERKLFCKFFLFLVDSAHCLEGLELLYPKTLF